MKTYELKLIKTPLWNPLTVYLDSGSYPLNNIVFYNEDGIVMNVGKGWFGQNSFGVTIATSKPCKRKIKVNFSKNETFVIKSDDCTYDKRYDLYVPINDIMITTTYTKDIIGIRANHKFVDLNDHECIWSEYVKTFYTMKYDITEKFVAESKKLEKLSCGNIPQNEFDTIIQNLKQLYDKYQKVLHDIENYTVEDYFKEVIQ